MPKGRKAGSVMDFEIIDEADIVSVARGRKSQVDPALVNALKGLPTGKAVRITAMKVDPKSEDFKNLKATKSAQIRNCAKSAGLEAKISWSPDGIPQVSVRPNKPKAKATK